MHPWHLICNRQELCQDYSIANATRPGSFPINGLRLLSASKSHDKFKSYYDLCLLHVKFSYGFESVLSSTLSPNAEPAIFTGGAASVHMNQSQAELIRLARWQLGREILGLCENFGNGFIPNQTTFEKLLRRFCTNLHSRCAQSGTRLRSPTVVNHSHLLCTQIDALTRDGRRMHPSRHRLQEQDTCSWISVSFYCLLSTTQHIIFFPSTPGLELMTYP